MNDRDAQVLRFGFLLGALVSLFVLGVFFVGIYLGAR